MQQRTAALAVLAVLALVPPVAGIFDQPFYLDLFGRVMVYAIAAISLDLILGYGGLVSFGHAAFLGIGGYAVAILFQNGLEDGLLHVPAAMLGSALFAFLTGLVVLRTGGAHFIMITLAFAQMLFFLFTSLEVYGGDDGLSLPARSTVAGQKWLDGDTALYYVIFAGLTGGLFLCRRAMASRFGLVLRGIHANERRLRSLGIPTFRYKLTAYVLSGSLCGFAGALLANETEFVSPNVMHWSRSGELIVMVVLGGMGSIYGAFLGAVAYLLLAHFLADITKHWHLIMGPLLICVVLFARGGLSGLVARLSGRAP
jgi:branched-chain amino acid transport system permease protein